MAGRRTGRAVLIGAAVSPVGGPAKAVARGVQRGAHAIQIFNQNPRAWKPRVYSHEEAAAFRAAMADSDVGALLIHAAYLLNCASQVPEFRAKTLASLTSSLRAGAALGAHAVVLHPGSALGGEVAPAIARAGEVIAEALAESEGCPLQLERLGSLHLNDSQSPLGSNRDRHANVGRGEIGPDGCAVLLSDPRFEGLPCVLETPGPRHSGPTREEIALARSPRERGLAARRSGVAVAARTAGA